MAAAIKFELVSPEKLIISRDVAMVTVPGSEGDYSVLAGHAPIITTVRPGVIDVYENENGQPNERLFVAGGFAETNHERCTVLAEQVTPVDQLNREQLEEELRRLTEATSTPSNDADRDAMQKELSIMRAKLLAAA
jgi:F-type H+-transporting ATPase subunit epsilon